jgi:hypothetical protein
MGNEICSFCLYGGMTLRFHGVEQAFQACGKLL